MNTEDLIVRLARDAQAVTPLRPPLVRLALWMPVAVVSIAAGTWIYGLREDHATMFASPGFVRDGVFAALVLMLGVAAALWSAVPGLDRRWLGRMSVVVAAVAWVTIAATAVLTAGHGFANAAHWPACAARALSVALVPGGLLYVLARRAHPLRPAWTFGAAAASAMAAGAIAAQLTCPLTDAGHLLLGHVLPVAVTALVVATLPLQRRLS